MLTLDIPPLPLYKDSDQTKTIPKENIYDLLEKYTGKTETKVGDDQCYYKIRKLPKFLIVHIKRFYKNNLISEKNPTIVISPLEGIDMKKCLSENSKNVKGTKYRLISNVIHEGKVTEGYYISNVFNKALRRWFEIQDLHTKETIESLVQISQSYIQFYERIDE